MSLPKLRYPIDREQILNAKRESEELRQKIAEKLKNKETLKKAVLIIEEMMKENAPKKKKSA